MLTVTCHPVCDGLENGEIQAFILILTVTQNYARTVQLRKCTTHLDQTWTAMQDDEEEHEA